MLLRVNTWSCDAASLFNIPIRKHSRASKELKEGIDWPSAGKVCCLSRPLLVHALLDILKFRADSISD